VPSIFTLQLPGTFRFLLCSVLNNFALRVKDPVKHPLLDQRIDKWQTFFSPDILLSKRKVDFHGMIAIPCRQRQQLVWTPSIASQLDSSFPLVFPEFELGEIQTEFCLHRKEVAKAKIELFIWNVWRWR
jgi:hypothetical protein